MIVRIVKLSFEENKVKDFLILFQEIKTTIRTFDGCLKMKLLNDLHRPNVFFTYSEWESEAALNKYRFSEFFKSTWIKTKILFSDKAEAWSSNIVD